jgi:hypothetical protein
MHRRQQQQQHLQRWRVSHQRRLKSLQLLLMVPLLL